MESLQIYYFFPKPRTFSYFFVMPGLDRASFLASTVAEEALTPEGKMPVKLTLPGTSPSGFTGPARPVFVRWGIPLTPEGKMPVKLTLPGTSPSGFTSPALAWATGGRKVGHCTEPAVAPDR